MYSSIILAVGISGTAHWNWMIWMPRIHSLSGWASAKVTTRSMHCSKLVQSIRLTQKSGLVVMAPWAKWVCESMRPGITRESPKSRTSVCSPM